MKPTAASVADTAVSCSSLRVRRRLRTKKNIQRQIVAAAKPTMRNTPATAPLLLKNWEPECELSSGLSVGFAMTCVTVVAPPSLFVEMKVDVISGGAVVAVCPRLLVVVIKTVLWKVVVAVSTRREDGEFDVGAAEESEGELEEVF